MGLPEISPLVVRNLIGVFYEEGSQVMVADELEGTLALSEQLAPLEGVQVHALAHHRPPEPPLKDRWGGGCCLLEPTGRCVSGHSLQSQWLYMFDETGVLERSEQTWGVRSDEGDLRVIRTDWLVGHRSQVVVVSIPAFEMPVIEDISSLKIEDLQERASEIQNYLSLLNRLKDGI